MNIDEDTEEELQPVGFKQYLKGSHTPRAQRHIFRLTALMGTCTIYVIL